MRSFGVTLSLRVLVQEAPMTASGTLPDSPRLSDIANVAADWHFTIRDACGGGRWADFTITIELLGRQVCEGFMAGLDDAPSTCWAGQLPDGLKKTLEAAVGDALVSDIVTRFRDAIRDEAEDGDEW